MKKLIAFLVIIAIMLSFAPVTMATAAKVSFSDLKYLDFSENEIPAVETGLVYTQVEANLNGTLPQSVFLIVMLCEKETGKIKEVASDSVTLKGDVPFATLKAGVNVNNLSDEVYRVFLWDIYAKNDTTLTISTDYGSSVKAHMIATGPQPIIIDYVNHEVRQGKYSDVPASASIDENGNFTFSDNGVTMYVYKYSGYINDAVVVLK